MEKLVSRIIDQFPKLPLPGIEAHARVFSADHIRYDMHKDVRLSAVLVPLVFKNGTLKILMIQRTNRGVHAGQIAFPGGSVEQIDNSLEDTARRETLEEIHLQNLEIVTNLSPIYIPVSNFMMYPYIAYSKEADPDLKLQKEEVDEVLYIDLMEFSTLPLQRKTVTARNTELEVNAYVYEGNVIWGASAMVLSEFQVLLKTLDLDFSN